MRIRRALLLLTPLALIAAEAPPPLDAEAVRRAEAAADAYLAEQSEKAEAPQSEPVALDAEQGERLNRVGVLLLEVTRHLEAGESPLALERYLEAQTLLEALPRRALDSRRDTALAEHRQRLVALGRQLLLGGHLRAPEEAERGAAADPAPAGEDPPAGEEPAAE